MFDKRNNEYTSLVRKINIECYKWCFPEKNLSKDEGANFSEAEEKCVTWCAET